MTALERDLYWAYEQMQVGVSSPVWTDVPRANHGGALDAKLAAAKIHQRVSKLPDLQRATLDAKYGLLPQGLSQLTQILVQQFRLPETVAQGFVLRWLDHHTQPKLWQLADEMDVSERTIKRRAKDIEQYLNTLCYQSLFALSA